MKTLHKKKLLAFLLFDNMFFLMGAKHFYFSSLKSPRMLIGPCWCPSYLLIIVILLPFFYSYSFPLLLFNCVLYPLTCLLIFCFVILLFYSPITSPFMVYSVSNAHCGNKFSFETIACTAPLRLSVREIITA